MSHRVLILLALAAVVILQNTESVETRLLLATITMPRALLLAVTFLFGAVFGLVLGVRGSRAK